MKRTDRMLPRDFVDDDSEEEANMPIEERMARIERAIEAIKGRSLKPYKPDFASIRVNKSPERLGAAIKLGMVRRELEVHEKEISKAFRDFNSIVIMSLQKMRDNIDSMTDDIDPKM